MGGGKRECELPQHTRDASEIPFVYPVANCCVAMGQSNLSLGKEELVRVNHMELSFSKNLSGYGAENSYTFWLPQFHALKELLPEQDPHLNSFTLQVCPLA